MSKSPSPAGARGRDALDPDAVIRSLAARQHGVVTREQLVRAGITPHRIEYRLKKGRLEPLYRGVFRVGPVASVREREVAAVLACGPGAVLSHRSAAVLWGLRPRVPGVEPVDVSIPRGCRTPGPGVRVHRVRSLLPGDVTRLDGVPVTTAARTLLDLAGCITATELERVLAVAERLGLAPRTRLARLVAQGPSRRGSRTLRILLSAANGPALTRSHAEAGFLALVRRARLPEPEANVVVCRHEVDFLWRAKQLIVEVDGFAYHAGRRAFEADRQRDAVHAAAGYRVMRVTWPQLSKEPEAVIARLAQALFAAG